MIIKSSTRGSRGLGAHLAAGENERAEVTRADGIVSIDPEDAVAELTAQGAASATASPLVHASISPDREMTAQQWDHAWREWERAQGLDKQPFIEVEHEKGGRTHRHRVYSRVDAEHGAVIKQHNNWITNERVARVLEHDLGHELTPGRHTRAVLEWTLEHRPDVARQLAPLGEQARPEASMTHNQWQQKTRTGIDPQAVCAAAAEAWQRSDSAPAFAAALHEQGLVLAMGEKTPQIVDQAGGTHDVRRTLRQAGEKVRAADVRELVPEGIEPVATVRDRQRAAARTAAAAPEPTVDTEGPGTGETGHGHATAPAQEAAATTAEHTTPDQARPGRPSEGDPVAQQRAHVHDLEARAARAPAGVGKDQAKKAAIREIAPEFATHERAYREAQQRRDTTHQRYKEAQRDHQRYEGIRGLVRAIRHPVRQRQAALQLERAADAADSADEALKVEQRERKRWKEWARDQAHERIDERAAEIRDGIEAAQELPRARQDLQRLEHKHEHEPQHEHEKGPKRDHGPRMKM